MTNIFPERDRCPENPTPKSLNRDAKMVTRSILATQPTVPRVPLGKAMAFASGLVLGMFSDPLNAAPPGGGDIVQVLCDALLSSVQSLRRGCR
jgi:hypothetical protein